MHTPAFIVWALARHCSLRQIANWEDAERTERLLRAARAYDEARADGRILDGVAFAPDAASAMDIEQVRGFRVEMALELYGGIAGLHAACDECPANALRGHAGREVAGCFGMWPLPADLAHFCHDVEAIVARQPETASLSSTTPRWYGLWLRSPLAVEAAQVLFHVLGEMPLVDPASVAGRDELLQALALATRGEYALHFRHYPPGQVDGPWWNLVPHCGHCQAPWTGGGICRVCRQTTHPASPKQRRVRGQRPYYPLVRLLRREAAADILIRYRQQLPTANQHYDRSPP